MKPHEIQLSPVKSSSVGAMGHAGTTLAVRYASGETYHYSGVTAKQYEDILKAKSIGAAMAGVKAKHKVTKVK